MSKTYIKTFEELIAWRRQGITGDDLAAVVGVVDGRSCIDVWQQKVEGCEDSHLSGVLRRQHKMESVAAAEYEELSGSIVVECDMIEDDINPALLGTPDRLAQLEDGTWVTVNLVVTDADEIDDARDAGPSQARIIKLQFDMWHTQHEVGHLFMLDPMTWECELFTIKRSTSLIDTLVARALAFWTAVDDEFEPKPDALALVVGVDTAVPPADFDAEMLVLIERFMEIKNERDRLAVEQRDVHHDIVVKMRKRFACKTWSGGGYNAELVLARDPFDPDRVPDHVRITETNSAASSAVDGGGGEPDQVPRPGRPLADPDPSKITFNVRSSGFDPGISAGMLKALRSLSIDSAKAVKQSLAAAQQMSANVRSQIDTQILNGHDPEKII